MVKKKVNNEPQQSIQAERVKKGFKKPVKNWLKTDKKEKKRTKTVKNSQNSQQWSKTVNTVKNGQKGSKTG